MLIVGPGLLSTSGAAHKKQRKLLNPVFSGAHMRDLTPIFHDVVQRVSRMSMPSTHAMDLTCMLQLRTAIETRIQDGPATLDVARWMGRTALELVGQGGLGHSFDPLTKDAQDEYAEAVKNFPYVHSPRFKNALESC